jgi:PAS domain S-box-containing protein
MPLSNDEWSLADFIELTGGWLWRTDTRFRICWLSENFESLYGVSREGYYNRPLAAVVADADDDEPWLRVRSAFDARRRFHEIDIPRHRDYEIRLYRISGIPLHEHGQFQGYRGIVRDITDEQGERQRIEQKQQRVAWAIDWFDGCLAHFDAGRRLIECNRKYRQVYEEMGLGHMLRPGVLFDDLIREQICGGRIEGLRGSGRENFDERMKWFHQGTPFEFQMDDGRWYQAVDQHLPDGSTLSLRLDVTALRQSQQEASILQQRLVSAIESFDNAVALFDAEERLLMYNDHYRSQLARIGVRIERGMHYETLLRGVVQLENRGEGWFRKRLQRFRDAGEPTEIQLADGRWILAKEHRLADGGTLAIRLDITRLKRVESDLRAAKQQAEQANALKTRFLSGASHDLRQPLQAMNFLIQLLEEQPDPALLAQVSSELRQTVTSMEDLVQNYLDISKLESGGIVPRIATFPIRRLLEQIHTHFSRQAAEKNLSLRVRPCPALVRSDQTLLKRIIDNLISNAIRYTDTGRILVGCRRQGDELLVGVWDTGVGIAENDIDRIFEELYQIRDDNRQPNGGQGLGLAISKHFAQLLEHPLSVRSTPGKGSFFGIKVPRA